MSASQSIYAALAWEELKFGMSPDEVISVVQHSTRVENNETTAKPVKELVRVNDYDLADLKFSMSFYFIENKLSNILLTRKIDENFDQALDIVKGVKSILSERYGQPNDSKIDNLLFVKESTTSWVSNGLSVSLVITGSSSSTINIYIRGN